MKIFILFGVCLTLGCYSSNQKNWPENFVQLKFEKICSAVEPASVAFRHNEILLFHAVDSSEDISAIYETFRFLILDSLSTKGHEILEIDAKDFKRYKDSLKKSDLYFEDIFSPNLRYENTMKKVAQFFDSIPFCGKVLTKSYKELNFSICTGSNKTIFITDSEDNVLIKKQCETGESVRDFFLFDVAGDTIPELIILANSSTGRSHKILEIQVYSWKRV